LALFVFLGVAAALIIVPHAVQAAQSYWSVGLPNYSGYANTEVTVTNIDAVPITATMSNYAGPVSATAVLPGKTGIMSYLDNFEGTQISPVAVYRIDTTDKEEVVQMTNAASYDATSDGTRLLPESELGSAYTIASWNDATPYLNPQPSYFVVVSTKDGTVVNVQVSVPTAASSPLSVPAVPAMGPGPTYTFTLNRGWALTVESSAGALGTCYPVALVGCPPGDLTGSRITSTANVAVFAGALCVNMSDSSCDAINDQMQPDSKAGVNYVLCSAAMSNTGQWDMVRVQAISGTPTITFAVAVSTSPWAWPTTTTATVTTAWSTFYYNRDTVITATAPVRVVQYLADSNVFSSVVPGVGLQVGSGDPAMVATTAIDLASNDHWFYGFSTWENHMYVGAAVGTGLMMDGAPLMAPARTIATSGYECLTPMLDTGTGGTHHIVGSLPIIVQVLGLGESTAYWFDAGTGKMPVPPPPPPPVPPVAAFKWQSSAGCGRVPTKFTDGSVAGSAPITTWAWDFGDGGASSDQNPEHTYDTDGDYNVILYVLDGNGLSSTATQTVTSLMNQPCIYPTKSEGNPNAPLPPRDGVDEALAGADLDGDGIPDASDNCPEVANADQADSNGNLVGDACDADLDGDGIVNASDNCPKQANSGQFDLDGDGLGDACDDDSDADGVANAVDDCPLVADKAQLDADDNHVGDACQATAQAMDGAGGAGASALVRPVGAAAVTQAPGPDVALMAGAAGMAALLAVGLVVLLMRRRA